jgi:hypothetical protein
VLRPLRRSEAKGLAATWREDGRARAFWLCLVEMDLELVGVVVVEEEEKEEEEEEEEEEEVLHFDAVGTIARTGAGAGSTLVIKVAVASAHACARACTILL